MEAAVEALLDAGIDPESVRGSRTGVYLGASTDSEVKSINQLQL